MYVPKLGWASSSDALLLLVLAAWDIFTLELAGLAAVVDILNSVV